MELAIPEVDELFPVELKVEAALDWLNSLSSDSKVLSEFLDTLTLVLFKVGEKLEILELGELSCFSSRELLIITEELLLIIIIVVILIIFLCGLV